MQYNYTVLYQRMPDGGFLVRVPAMLEIVTYGQTREEARLMAEDAIRCVLESAQKTGEAIPDDVQPTAESLAITVV